ncbi:aminoglycoside phosphotransferase family protein [Wenxinia saemankumensis]|uniref:Streptomycin 6-kinase n=1 Tax=Wenxinia saemankumensis TaxID=1447782 RepID=A0A1M6EPL3_9RHOB|nr:aminoglycoside phosphotransferase family protein [Wenxinia saemankumensis]SHI87467.1 streptomycin 6-kinase [Wenxinia saemankumensis]
MNERGTGLAALQRARPGDARLRRARALLARWQAVPEGAARLSGLNLLWPARLAGQPVLLKLARADDDEAGAGAFLAALRGDGAVRILRRQGPATLMERLAPVGPSLAAMVADGRADAATRILAAAARRVIARRILLPTLLPWEGRAGTLTDHLSAGRVPPELRPAFARAAALSAEIAAGPRGDWTGLHGDLHHGNLIRDRVRGWLLIDPKGLLGPPGYEIANILGNPFPLPPTRARIDRQADVLAEAASLPRKEVLRWTWVHAAYGTVWSLTDADRPHWQAVMEIADDLRGRGD